MLRLSPAPLRRPEFETYAGCIYPNIDSYLFYHDLDDRPSPVFCELWESQSRVIVLLGFRFSHSQFTMYLRRNRRLWRPCYYSLATFAVVIISRNHVRLRNGALHGIGAVHLCCAWPARLHLDLFPQQSMRRGYQVHVGYRSLILRKGAQTASRREPWLWGLRLRFVITKKKTVLFP